MQQHGPPRGVPSIKWYTVTLYFTSFWNVWSSHERGVRLVMWLTQQQQQKLLKSSTNVTILTRDEALSLKLPWRWLPCGLLQRVVWYKPTDSSEVLVSSTIRATLHGATTQNASSYLPPWGHEISKNLPCLLQENSVCYWSFKVFYGKCWEGRQNTEVVRRNLYLEEINREKKAKDIKLRIS